MLYRPSALVWPGTTTLVSTLVASTLPSARPPPLVSVTRPVKVAVGPARREPVSRPTINNIRNSNKPGRSSVTTFNLQNFVYGYSDYAARITVLYQPSHDCLVRRG